MTRFALILLLLATLTASAAWATLNIPSDGSDGVFAPPGYYNTTVDLSQATRPPGTPPAPAMACTTVRNGRWSSSTSR